MKTVSLLLVLWLVTSTAFAESRGILVELIPHQGDAPTVNIYSDVQSEQKAHVSVSDATFVLKQAKGWGSIVSVYILAEQYIDTKDLISVLEGMKDNSVLRVALVELGASERGKELLTRFKALSKKAPSP